MTVGETCELDGEVFEDEYLATVGSLEGSTKLSWEVFTNTYTRSTPTTLHLQGPSGPLAFRSTSCGFDAASRAHPVQAQPDEPSLDDFRPAEVIHSDNSAIELTVLYSVRNNNIIRASPRLFLLGFLTGFPYSLLTIINLVAGWLFDIWDQPC